MLVVSLLEQGGQKAPAPLLEIDETVRAVARRTVEGTMAGDAHLSVLHVDVARLTLTNVLVRIFFCSSNPRRPSTLSGA